MTTTAYLQKHAISLLHDVCFVHRRDPPPVVQVGKLKGVLCNCEGPLLGDDLATS
jgi:hypothetical protein